MSILKNNLFIWTTLFAAFMAISLSLFILIFFKILPNKLPFFYSLPWGERQLANHAQFLIIPATIILITLINLIVSKQLHPYQSFLKTTLNLTSIITTVILTIAFIKIVLIFI